MKAASIKIHLFGEFLVLRGGVPIGSGEWGRQKTRSVLKLLLTRPGRVFSRDEILEALWPDTSPEAAERSLRVTVSLLRRTLEPDLERGSDSRYILRRRPGYAFDRNVGCEVDAWEFEERRVKAEAAWEAERFDLAIEEYRGPSILCGASFLRRIPTKSGRWRIAGCFKSVASRFARGYRNAWHSGAAIRRPWGFATGHWPSTHSARTSTAGSCSITTAPGSKHLPYRSTGALPEL